MLNNSNDRPEGTALVLEGGAMRGIFTTGVLDAFMEKGIYFSRIVAISAGTMQALCYLSRQKGRNARVNISYAPDHRYMGLRHLIKGGSYFNFSFMFGELANKLVPFDYETFRKAPEIMYAVVTDTESGKVRYMNNHDYDTKEFFRICEASCSIPLFSKPVKLGKREYVDGGVGMPLAPLPEELPFPVKKAVYVLTRDVTYRKPLLSSFMKPWLHLTIGSNYPKIAQEMFTIPERYNDKIDAIHAKEADGSAFILRPSEPTVVSRVEKDPEKLRHLYEDGLYVGRKNAERMMRWINED